MVQTLVNEPRFYVQAVVKPAPCRDSLALPLSHTHSDSQRTMIGRELEGRFHFFKWEFAFDQIPAPLPISQNSLSHPKTYACHAF